MSKDRHFTTFRIQMYISNLVRTTHVWIHLWSSVTERILKGEKVKYIQVVTCHIVVSGSNQDLEEVDFLVFIDLRWKVVVCFVSIDWIVDHRYFNVISIKWLRMKMKKIDKEIDSRQFLIFNFFKLVQNRIQERSI
jgi:hypothetical protein